MKLMTLILTALTAAALAGACSARTDAQPAKGSDTSSVDSVTTVPAFSADSALSLIEAQTAPGPRVPGSKAHSECSDMLIERLSALNPDTIIINSGVMTAHDGKNVPIRNILAAFSGTNPKRRPLMLVAHYDTRPVADEDPDPANHTKPIDGANDGASGAAVALEIARLVSMQPTATPLYILLVDAEDGGSTEGGEESWCLGTQYWCRSLPLSLPRDSRPVALAIGLDMVGGKDAVFHRELFSERNSPHELDHLSHCAAAEGVASRFPSQRGGAVIDDHLFIQRAGIPAIDIVEHINPQTGSFAPTWHTMADRTDNISTETLDAVGRTVTRFIYTYDLQK